MPGHRIANAVRLEFEAASRIRTNLSGAAVTEDCLWVVGDEACGIERLHRLDTTGREMLRFGNARTFPLAGLLDLPGGPDEEADLEGLALADGYLWVVGSHGLKRVKPESKIDESLDASRLAELVQDRNRRILARLPIERDGQGLPSVVQRSSDGRQAMRLAGDERHNMLTRALAEDPHFGPFMSIPGKDNGFDVEGLAIVSDRRLLLGLRGPVLRGWAALLEIELIPRDDRLELTPLDPSGPLIRKHFLDLGGLGVRDLHFSGEDLYVLAGPTMALDGEIRLFKWSNARLSLASATGSARCVNTLSEVATLPHGRGTDRAEAVCSLPRGMARAEHGWLVLYDAPGPERRAGKKAVFGDMLDLD